MMHGLLARVRYSKGNGTKNVGPFCLLLFDYEYSKEAFGKRNPIVKALNSCLDISPEFSLELHSRAAPSEKAHYHVNSPDKGRIF